MMLFGIERTEKGGRDLFSPTGSPTLFASGPKTLPRGPASRPSVLGWFPIRPGRCPSHEGNSTYQILPLGSEGPRTVDVRLIAATNKELTAEVQAGRFRHDLYFRLNVIHIRVPPLRERQEDIPALVDHFLLYFWKEEGLPLKRLTSSAEALLAKQDWPGNIRELRNAIERLVVLSEDDCITAGEVEQTLETMETVPANSRSPIQTPSPVVPLQEAVAQYERACIIQALIAHDWNRQNTADALGINRTYLWRKMQRYQIEAP